MSEAIEVLGVRAKQREGSYRARTPLGRVTIHVAPSDAFAWTATWRLACGRGACVTLADYEPSPAAAAREATRRLRAIMRTCARAAAREEA